MSIRSCRFSRATVADIVKHSFVIGINVQHYDDVSSVLLVIVSDKSQTSRDREADSWEAVSVFPLLDHINGFELGNIANPGGDSLVATVFQRQPVPGSDRHLLITLRNDCPIIESMPFRKYFTYPKREKLSQISRENVGS